MEQIQNFGPNDVQNGVLAQMFRKAGINDVNTYINEIRQENSDVNNNNLRMRNNENHIPVHNPQSFAHEPQQTDGFLTNVQKLLDKCNQGKNPLGNAKKMFEMYKSLDKNGDGKITVEDIEILLKEMGLGFVSKHLARALFNIVDTNHNGRLDFHDVLALTTLLKRLSSSSVTSDKF